MRAAEVLPLGDDVLRGYIGGVGLGAWLMHRLAPPGVDPLGPEAPLVFVLLAARRHPADDLRQVRGRGEVAAHRAALRRAGLVSLRDRGQAHRRRRDRRPRGLRTSRPCCSSTATVARLRAGRRPLGPVGGRGRGAAPRAARQGLAGRGDRPGGRAPDPVRDAQPRRPPRRPRRPGRGPRLEADQGGRGPGDDEGRSADPAAVLAAARDLRARSFGPATEKYRELGTVANLLAFNRFATLPTRNFQRADFEGAERLAAEDLADARGVARDSCASCTIGCEHIYDRRRRETALEYESLFALGPLCGVADPDAVLAAAAAATSSASTRSRPAARSPSRWNAPSAG